MEFNGLKFQALKYGRNSEMKDEYEYVNSEFSQFIENVNSTRDLGIIMSTDGHFDEHIDKVVTKSRQRCGWINRSFLNNEIEFRRSIWRTYIESYMDYGSQVWTPVDQGSIKYTKGLETFNYWQRLEIIRLLSVQRRHEK